MRTYLLYIVAGYFALWLATLTVADLILYQPPKPSTYLDDELIIKLPMKQSHDAMLSGVYLPNPDAKYTLLYLHGNAGDLGSIKPILSYFHSNGYSIMSIDYPSYGTSTGQASEERVYQSARVAYDYLVNERKVPPERIIFYGKSLGAAVALDLALHRKGAALIMDSPFLSAFRAYTQLPLFLFDRYNNADKINQLNTPVLFIHGTSDNTLWPWQTKALYNMAPEPKAHYWVFGAGHNDLFTVAGKQLWVELNRFLVEINKAKESAK